MNPEDAAKFLSALHPAATTANLVQFVALKPPKPTEFGWHWDPSCSALRDVFDLNSRGYDVYVGVNPRTSMSGGRKANIGGVHALPIDLDTIKTGVQGDDVGALLKRMDIPPSLGVFSGNGVHFYLLLDRVYPVAEAEPVAKRLCFSTFGDMVHNASRIMRLPGTVSWKEDKRGLDCELYGYRPDRRYTLAQVTAALDAANAPNVERPVRVGPPVKLPDAPPDIHALIIRLPGYMQEVVQLGAPPAWWTSSSSELDWAIICALVRLGATNVQIAAVYASYPVRHIKAARAGGAYLQRTVDRAREAVQAELQSIPEEDELAWVAESGGLFFLDGQHVRVNKALSRELVRKEFTRLAGDGPREN